MKQQQREQQQLLLVLLEMTTIGSKKEAGVEKTKNDGLRTGGTTSSAAATTADQDEDKTPTRQAKSLCEGERIERQFKAIERRLGRKLTQEERDEWLFQQCLRHQSCAGDEDEEIADPDLWFGHDMFGFGPLDYEYMFAGMDNY